MNSSYAVERRQKLHFTFRYRVRARLVSRVVNRYLESSSGLRVLDFGSADGLTLLELNRLLPFCSFFGVEISDELLGCVPKLPDNIRIVKGDAIAHVFPMDRQRMIGLVQDAGLQLLTYEQFMWAPLGILPYLRISVPPDLSLRLDRMVNALRLLDWSFVNQCIVARAPNGE
jgi:hypothetical protein